MKITSLLTAFAALFVLAGCSSSAPATATEEKNFREPSKTPPPQAVPGGAPPEAAKGK